MDSEAEEDKQTTISGSELFTATELVIEFLLAYPHIRDASQDILERASKIKAPIPLGFVHAMKEVEHVFGCIPYREERLDEIFSQVLGLDDRVYNTTEDKRQVKLKSAPRIVEATKISKLRESLLIMLFRHLFESVGSDTIPNDRYPFAVALSFNLARSDLDIFAVVSELHTRGNGFLNSHREALKQKIIKTMSEVWGLLEKYSGCSITPKTSPRIVPFKNICVLADVRIPTQKKKNSLDIQCESHLSFLWGDEMLFNSFQRGRRDKTIKKSRGLEILQKIEKQSVDAPTSRSNWDPDFIYNFLESLNLIENLGENMDVTDIVNELVKRCVFTKSVGSAFIDSLNDIERSALKAVTHGFSDFQQSNQQATIILECAISKTISTYLQTGDMSAFGGYLRYLTNKTRLIINFQNPSGNLPEPKEGIKEETPVPAITDYRWVRDPQGCLSTFAFNAMTLIFFDSGNLGKLIRFKLRDSYVVFVTEEEGISLKELLTDKVDKKKYLNHSSFVGAVLTSAMLNMSGVSLDNVLAVPNKEKTGGVSYWIEVIAGKSVLSCNESNTHMINPLLCMDKMHETLGEDITNIIKSWVSMEETRDYT